jgi:pilus assembly protein FimV
MRNFLIFILFSILFAPLVHAQETYGPIKEGDMLWTIASKMRSDRSISRIQMMMAIFHTNTQAFNLSCNANSPLKRGSILQIPDKETV